MTDFVSYATSRYCLDEEQTKLLAEFHKHVWKDCKIENVGQLTEYENLYRQYSEKFVVVYDTEVDELGFVDMNDGEACLLSKGRFEQLSKNLSTSKFATKSREYELSDLEIVVLLSFLADILTSATRTVVLTILPQCGRLSTGMLLNNGIINKYTELHEKI